MTAFEEQGNKYRYPLHLNSLLRVLSFQQFLEYLKNTSGGDTVLDYGAGDRPYEKLLLTKFRRYLAADNWDTNQNYTRRPDLIISNGVIDLPSNTVDCVVLTEVLEHLYEPKIALNELHRVLRPGGVLIGSVPFAMNHHDEPYDFHRYTYFCLKRMFEDTRFEIKQLDYIGDMIAVAIMVFGKVLGVIPKLLRRLRLSWLAAPVALVLKGPDFLYFWVYRAGWKRQKMSYLRKWPLGFTFLLSKPAEPIPHTATETHIATRLNV